MEARYHGTIMERPAEPGGRIAAVGHQLIEVHLWLREELARLRDDVDSYLDGRGARPSAAQSLGAHCLVFCAAVRRHHTGEDDDGFPALAARLLAPRPLARAPVCPSPVVASRVQRAERREPPVKRGRTAAVLQRGRVAPAGPVGVGRAGGSCCGR